MCVFFFHAGLHHGVFLTHEWFATQKKALKHSTVTKRGSKSYPSILVGLPLSKHLKTETICCL